MIQGYTLTNISPKAVTYHIYAKDTMTRDTENLTKYLHQLIEK